MYLASRPTPGITSEPAEYWKNSPTKYKPGSVVTTPRSCRSSPSSPKMGRSIHDRSWRKPVHQITFATSRTRPSSSTGFPPRTPTVFGTRWTPPARICFGLTRTNMSPWDAYFLFALRPIGVRIVITCSPKNLMIRNATFCANHLSTSTGTCPRSGPESQVGCEPTTSSETSAPELPAPTTSTPPSRSCDGLRYSLEWNCTIPGSSSRENEGILGSLSAPEATMTLSASIRSPPTDRTYPSLSREIRSTCRPVRTGRSNLEAYARR